MHDQFEEIVACLSEWYLQLRIQVADGGQPPCVQTSVATITVNHNLFAPSFNQQQYDATILEIFSLSLPITTLTGQDQDTTVRSFLIY